MPKSELLSNLVFEACWSCCYLAVVGGFNSVFERNACDDFSGQSKPRSFHQFCSAHCPSLDFAIKICPSFGSSALFFRNSPTIPHCCHLPIKARRECRWHLRTLSLNFSPSTQETFFTLGKNCFVKMTNRA